MLLLAEVGQLLLDRLKLQLQLLEILREFLDLFRLGLKAARKRAQGAFALIIAVAAATTSAVASVSILRTATHGLPPAMVR
jgi:hypothetical protein